MKVIADENIPYVGQVFAQFGEVVTLPGREIGPEAVEDADLLLVRSITKVNERLLKKSRVRFVGTATIGVDHVDIAYLKKRGIAFASAPGSNATSVAEYVVSALLNLSDRHGFKLEDKSVGIIGVGNVGSRVEKRLRALGLKVVLNDPPLFKETKDPKYRSIEEIQDCDIITVHTPLNKSGPYMTFHMIDGRFLEKTRPGLIFINTSRGSVVDQKALAGYHRKGHFGACVLDVWENEPNIDTDLLMKVDIGTSHIAGYSFDGKVRGTEMIYRAAVGFFEAESQWRLNLPAPEVPEIQLPARMKNDEAFLRAAVFPIYDVARDCTRLRAVTEQLPDKRGDFFDRLRKEYPIRREFANTRLVLKKSRPALLAKLKALEFLV
jgi:erythronate-4-phosphate dehydrogenase